MLKNITIKQLKACNIHKITLSEYTNEPIGRVFLIEVVSGKEIKAYRDGEIDTILEYNEELNKEELINKMKEHLKDFNRGEVTCIIKT